MRGGKLFRWEKKFNILLVVILLFSIFLYVEANEEYKKFGEQLINKISEKTLTEHTKIWVEFTDKHIFSEEEKENLKRELREALSEHTLKRRLKVKSLENLITEDDFPVSQFYITEITKISGVEHKRTSKWLNSISITIKSDQIESLKQIANLPFVKEVELVDTFKKRLIEEKETEVNERSERTEKEIDTKELDYGKSYDQIHQINVDQLHSEGYDGSGIIILILDSGFNLQHPSTKNLDIIDQYDFVNGDDNVSNQSKDQSSSSNPEKHGTATLSACGGKDQGNLYGPAFGASFLLGKTEDLTKEDPIEEDNFANALEWGEGLGCDLVSASLGYQDWYDFSSKDGTDKLDLAIDKMVKLGVVVIVAAGNDEAEGLGITVPGDAKLAITVGAVALNGDVTYFSSQGPSFDGRIKPEVSALGSNVYVANCNLNPNYTTMSGTSFATPLVAGATALLLQIHPEWTPIDVLMALTSTASNTDDPNVAIGWGVIDAMAASEYTPPTDPSTEHGVCNDYNYCDCDYPYYGPYCSFQKLPCDVYCIGGECIDQGSEIRCECPSRWKGKVCAGKCDKHKTCTSCLQTDVAECVWCLDTSSCIGANYTSTCHSDYSTSYCVSEVNLDPDNMESYLVIAVILLCFSLLLLGSVSLFFFCIVRP